MNDRYGIIPSFCVEVKLKSLTSVYISIPFDPGEDHTRNNGGEDHLDFNLFHLTFILKLDN
ncbi:hypothetical protein AWM70_15170 [Paenibacillus yonginensis]|uniref:Uncharacterized protein n=1 Tax=Paenibacillus yonginensis TaxID=1462996 RepID=A0A1B1N2Z7_9BACL|nr:hypothetical protein [Paenibacillus yonginensis]ANS75776.1 hypothetical protein AWM70_15170 [Paenibacillus yonginensis]